MFESHLPMECEATQILDDRPLRQGDVFMWTDRHHEHPWQHCGVVVTADCDLAHGKTHGRISYVPAIAIEHYIWMFWRPYKFSRVLDADAIRLAKRLSKALARQMPEHKGISPDAAIAWIERSATEEIAKELGIDDNGQVKELRDIITRVKSTKSLLDCCSPDMGLLIDSYSSALRSDVEKTRNQLSNDIKGLISSLPGDVFFLSGIPDASVHPSFLMLRHISQCDLDDIGLTADDVRYGRARSKRVARIGAPYVYAITQSLARVFSDIGLPQEYETRKKGSAEIYFSSMENIR